LKSNNKKRELVDGKLLCPICQTYKELEEFHNCKGATFDRAYYCKVCSIKNSRENHLRRMKNDPQYRRAKCNGWIKLAWRMSVDEYEELLAKQDYACAICKVELPTGGHKTHLDHCHKTGKIRAFLCTNCNRGLGHFQDSTDLLSKAIAYIEYHAKEVTNL
jgi:hypothetical protein